MIFLFVLAFASIICISMSDDTFSNNYPVVLLPGFLACAPDGLYGSISMWGGFHGNLAVQLEEQGFTVISVAGGPVSSSYDRTVEIYTQLVGGKVDYGEAHSLKYGHFRYGETYKQPLYPSISDENKIHLVAHSFGGLDCRLLTHMLNYGSSDEINLSKSNGGTISPLFQGGHDWIASCTTISSPHDGTSLALFADSHTPILQQLIVSIASLSGIEAHSHLYDFKLHQWGITRYENETLQEYVRNVFSSKVWEAKRDISSWDLSPDGAAEFNDYVRVVPHVYYFTYATSATRESLLHKTIQLPDLDMSALLWPVGALLGSFDHIIPSDSFEVGKGLPPREDIEVNSKWHRNDGVVNTNSMSGPKTGFNRDKEKPVIISLKESDRVTIQTGIFYNFPILKNWDHISIVGFGLWDILPFFTKHLSILRSLKPASSTVVEVPVNVVKVTKGKHNIHEVAKRFFCETASNSQLIAVLESALDNLCAGKELLTGCDSSTLAMIRNEVVVMKNASSSICPSRDSVDHHINLTETDQMDDEQKIEKNMLGSSASSSSVDEHDNNGNNGHTVHYIRGKSNTILVQ